MHISDKNLDETGSRSVKSHPPSREGNMQNHQYANKLTLKSITCIKINYNLLKSLYF
jgi:hypothetical protein